MESLEITKTLNAKQRQIKMNQGSRSIFAIYATLGVSCFLSSCGLLGINRKDSSQQDRQGAPDAVQVTEASLSENSQPPQSPNTETPTATPSASPTPPPPPPAQTEPHSRPATLFNEQNPLENAQPITLDEAAQALEPIFNLENQKCEMCHFNWKSQIKEWALATKDQALRNRALFGPDAEQALADLKANPAEVTGIFKAYPEYYERFFLHTGTVALAPTVPSPFEQFAAAIQPAGAAGLMAFQTSRFAQAGSTGADPMPQPQHSFSGSQNEQELHPLDAQAQDDFYRALSVLLRVAATTASETETTCTTKLSESYKIHIREMQVSGFHNLYQNKTLFGCSEPGIAGTNCFSTYPSQAGSAGGGRLMLQEQLINHRMVRVQNVQATSFWARTSADGRFVANGDGEGKVHDLEKKIQWNFKGTRFDPSFMPNGSGLSFHGDGAIFCTMEAITREPTAEERADPANIRLIDNEPWLSLNFDPKQSPFCIHGNMTADIATYQSVGSVVGLGKTYVLTGSHVSDDGNVRPAALDFSGVINLFEVSKMSRSFGEVKKVSSFNVPGEGDYMIGPSSRYIVGRIAGRPGQFDEPIQLGLKLRSLKEIIASVRRDGTNDFNAQAQEDQSTICTAAVPGNSSKPMMSLDERFMVFHLYDGMNTNDQSAGSEQANIYIVDLLHPEHGPIKVTDFTGSDQALFPHFRADGWLLFIVRNNTADDDLFASDIAVQLSNRFKVPAEAEQNE